MTARRLCQLIALALAALTLWVIISASQVRPDDAFAIEIYASFFVMVAILIAVSFYALRFGASGSAMYWSVERKDQVRMIGWMILATLATILALDIPLVVFGLLGPHYSTEVSYLLAVTVVPAVFLKSGVVVWPVRSGRPEKLKLILVGAAAICLVGAYSYSAYTSIAAPDRIGLSPVGPMLVRLASVIVGATAEEITHRVLLLTAMLRLTGSRFQAVFFSGVVFGIVHVPGTFAQSVALGDWDMLQRVAHDYAPGFLAQVAVGLGLGVLWLRTGSIILIASTHALLNAGTILALGL